MTQAASKDHDNARPSVLDLFSGGGGFSLGAHDAGFQTKIAIDADAILSSSFAVNFPGSKLLNRDIRAVDAAALKSLLPSSVDGVVGGPPCQAFSEMGRRDIADPRRSLVIDFFRIVSLVKPKFFVFENVRGLGFDTHRALLDEGRALVRNYKLLGPTILNAADFGAPTKRRRLFIVGFNPDEMDVPDAETLFRPTGIKVTVRDAINDLSGAKELREREDGFDAWKYDGRKAVSAYAEKMRAETGTFTGHRKTAHTAEIVKRFSKVLPRKSDKVGKYVRLDWDGLCPTLRAGTGSDRGSYQAVRPLHPSEDRVITPREAARLQGFPDDFLFHPTVWHSCRMIGNSVSPILARILMKRIKRQLRANSHFAMAAE